MLFWIFPIWNKVISDKWHTILRELCYVYIDTKLRNTKDIIMIKITTRLDLDSRSKYIFVK